LGEALAHRGEVADPRRDALEVGWIGGPAPGLVEPLAHLGEHRAAALLEELLLLVGAAQRGALLVEPRPLVPLPHQLARVAVPETPRRLGEVDLVLGAPRLELVEPALRLGEALERGLAI